MLELRTSRTHPLRVDTIDVPNYGPLGMTFAPGKKAHSLYHPWRWERDLEADLTALETQGFNLLVSLVETWELTEMGIPDLFPRAQEHHLNVIHFPIPDQSVPTHPWLFEATLDTLTTLMTLGQKPVIHCKGGLGRTGLMAAGVLIRTVGYEPDEAMAIVRKARPGAIETLEQERYLYNLA